MGYTNLHKAINKNDNIFRHSDAWTNSWIEYCQKNDVSFDIVESSQSDIVDKLQHFDWLL